MEALIINKKMRALIEQSRQKNSSNYFSTNKNVPDPNSNTLTIFQKRQLKALLGKTDLSANVEGQHNENSSTPPTTLLHYYTKILVNLIDFQILEK